MMTATPPVNAPQRQQQETVDAVVPLNAAEQRTVLAELFPAGDHSHDFVGSLKDAVDAQIAQDTFDRIVLQIAVAAVQLQRTIGD